MIEIPETDIVEFCGVLQTGLLSASNDQLRPNYNRDRNIETTQSYPHHRVRCVEFVSKFWSVLVDRDRSNSRLKVINDLVIKLSLSVKQKLTRGKGFNRKTE